MARQVVLLASSESRFVHSIHDSLEFCNIGFCVSSVLRLNQAGVFFSETGHRLIHGLELIVGVRDKLDDTFVVVALVFQDVARGFLLGGGGADGSVSSSPSSS